MLWVQNYTYPLKNTNTHFPSHSYSLNHILFCLNFQISCWLSSCWGFYNALWKLFLLLKGKTIKLWCLYVHLHLNHLLGKLNSFFQHYDLHENRVKMTYVSLSLLIIERKGHFMMVKQGYFFEAVVHSWLITLPWSTLMNPAAFSLCCSFFSTILLEFSSL